MEIEPDLVCIDTEQSRLFYIKQIEAQLWAVYYNNQSSFF